MSDHPGRVRVRPPATFRAAALTTAFATWALVAVGGLVRISESGLGCPDWPLCDGRIVPSAQQEPVIEYAHRATAAVVIGLLLVTVIWALRRRERREITLPFALALALVPVQALLGATVVWLELPDRLVGVHFMIGMVMLGLATLGAVAACRGATSVSETFSRWTLLGGGVALLLVSLGAGVVATDGMHACGQKWPSCNGGLADGGGVAVLQVAHRTTAYTLTGIAALLLALGLRGHAPLRVSAPLAGIATTQILFGIGIVLSSHSGATHDLFRGLHVAGAGAVWACAIAIVGLVVTAPVGAADVARASTRTTDARALEPQGLAS